MIYIKDINYYIPENRISIDKLSDRYQFSKLELSIFKRVYGLNKVPISDIPVKQMIENALTNLVAKADIILPQIDYLIFTHTSQEYTKFFESTLNTICNKLGLVNAKCFGMTTNNCASTITALDVIERLFKNENKSKKAILVTADVAFTPVLQKIPDSSVTGDSCVVSLLENTYSKNCGKLLSNTSKIYGEHSKCQWQTKDEMKTFETKYAQRLAEIMNSALSKANLKWSEISLLIPHNVNTYSWKNTARLIDFPLNQIYLDQVPKIAHCFGADLFINLSKALNDSKVTKGDKILIATVGLGAVFAAAVIEF